MDEEQPINQIADSNFTEGGRLAHQGFGERMCGQNAVSTSEWHLNLNVWIRWTWAMEFVPLAYA